VASARREIVVAVKNGQAIGVEEAPRGQCVERAAEE
jgi:hypothetical protein